MRKLDEALVVEVAPVAHNVSRAADNVLYTVLLR